MNINVCDQIKYYCKNLFELPIIKVIGTQTFIILNVFDQIKGSIYSITFLVILDFITGIYVSGKYKKISSMSIKRTLVKWSVYIILIFLIALMEKLLYMQGLGVAITGLIITTEILSILENLELMFPGILPKKIVERLGIHFKRKNKRQW